MAVKCGFTPFVASIDTDRWVTNMPPDTPRGYVKVSCPCLNFKFSVQEAPEGSALSAETRGGLPRLLQEPTWTPIESCTSEQSVLKQLLEYEKVT